MKVDKTFALLLSLAPVVAFAQLPQSNTLHFTGTGLNADRAQSCAQSRGSVQAQIAGNSQQRNTHHFNYRYSSNVSDCNCTSQPVPDRMEYCITATAPDCVNNQRIVRTPPTWSCSATGTLHTTVTPTK